MNHDVDAFLAVTLAAAAAAVGVALVSPTNAYAESTAEYTTPFVGTSAELKHELNSWGDPNS